MKKLTLVLPILLAGALSAAPAHAAPLKVVATTQDLESLAKEVGGDKIQTDSLAKGYQDPHQVEPKPSFILKLHSADLLIVVGRELEIGWLPPLIDQARNPLIQPGADRYLDASNFAHILEIPTGQITRAMGDVHPEGNPHYWLSPENGRRIAQGIQKKLSEISPADAGYFAQRYADFDKRLADSEKKWAAAMAPYKGAKIVTYHRSWPNFVETYGLNVVGYVEPKPGIPPSPSHTYELTQEMKKDNVKIIIIEPYFDSKTPNAIGRDSGAQVVTLAPSVGGAKGAPVSDYLQLFDYDVKTLVAAFQAAGMKGGASVMHWDILQFLLPAFTASLVIAGIHAYLGVHVVERGVIFVDLSLAQIAAFGATLSILMPWSNGDPHSPQVYWISLLFTFIGAGIFSFVRSRHARIPQEAIIGIWYAVASAATILALSKSTSEGEHLKDMLVGNLLSVSWPEVWTTAILYLFIGAFHFVFRKRFLAMSMNPDQAEAQGVSLRLWDFLFYASFGFVVTRSVSLAGVLLVFCYLIVPSVAAMLYARNIGPRLAIGWTMGTVVSALGVWLSLQLDLPTGATIVCTFGVVLILMAAVRPLIRPNGVVAAPAQTAR